MPGWVICSLLAIATFGIWGIVTDLASRAFPALAVQVLSTLGFLPVALSLLFSPGLLRGKPVGLAALSALAAGICGSLGNVCLYRALGSGGDASFVFPLTGMYPLITVVLAVSLLRERLHPVHLLGLGLAVIAFVLFGLQASTGGVESQAGWLSTPSLLAYLSLVLFGIVGFLQKIAAREVSSELSTVLFAGGFLLVCACILPFTSLEWGSASEVAPAIASGALLGIGTLLLFAAYRRGKASVITPLTALYPAVTAVLAVPLLGDDIDKERAAAIAIAILAAVALSREAGETGGPPAPGGGAST